MGEDGNEFPSEIFRILSSSAESLKNFNNIPLPRGRLANSLQSNKVSRKQNLKININFYDKE